MKQTCECWRYPNMHDKERVCVNWDLHGGSACDDFHTQRGGKS